MNHEETARTKHKMGNNCATSVYTSFADVNPNMGQAPMPRSDGGKCGAVLAAEKTLKEMGIDKADEFEQEFIARFGSVKCGEILRQGRRCNDCVGIAAAIVDSMIQ